MKKIKKFKIKQGMMFYNNVTQEHYIVMKTGYHCELYNVEGGNYFTSTDQKLIYMMNNRTLHLKVTSNGKIQT